MKTADKRERGNIIVYLLFGVISGISSNIMAEGYVQAYFVKLGFDTGNIRNYGITVQIISIFAYLIFSRLPPVTKKLQKVYALAVLLSGIFPAVLLAAGYIPSFAAAYAAVLAAAVLCGFINSFRGVADFNMLPHLFPRSLYGSVVSKSMVIGGIATVIISGSASLLFGYGGSRIYIFLFSVPVLALAASAFLALLYKFEPVGPEKTPKGVSYSELVKKVASPRYIKILAPHFLRGAALAGMYYIVPSVLKNIGLSESEKSYFIAVSVASAITGSFIFTRLAAKMKSGVITLISVIGCSAVMPVLVVCSDKYAFFALYFFFMVSNIISQMSIPTGVLRSTPDGELSFITSMRFVLMGTASALFIFIFGVLLKYIDSVYIMLFSGSFFVLCGVFCKFLFDDRL